MSKDERDWSSCTFEGAERNNLRLGMRMTFADKLRWLEDMHSVVAAFQKGPVNLSIDSADSDASQPSERKL